MLVPSDCFFFFFFNDTATTEIYTLSLHDALPISKAFSYASFGLIHELTALASRTTLMRYRSTRSKNEASVDVASGRSEEHTSELQSPDHLVCRLLLEKKKTTISIHSAHK